MSGLQKITEESPGNPIALMLARFLNAEDQKALLIRGAWGVGKSYAVKDFLKSYNFSALGGVIAQSYVSLFGKQSLTDIQRNIFSCASQVGEDKIIRQKIGFAAQKLINLEKYIAASKFQRALRWLRSKLGLVQLPWIGGLGSMFNQGNYDLVNSFLVTFDDLERRSEAVSLKGVLGLVDDLAVHRNCKVIVICNDDALDEDEQQLLSTYKEKIFDIDLSFIRSPQDISKIGLPSNERYSAVSEGILTKLGVSNIRVAKKYAYFVRQFWEEISDSDPRIVQEVLEHAAILTWARYDSTSGVPREKLSYVSSEGSWMAAAMRGEDENKEGWEAVWDAAASALQYSSEPYDKHLVDYLISGIWVPGSLKEVIAEKSIHIERFEASEAMRVAWDRYANSLQPDQVEFVEAMKSVIAKYGPLLPPRNVDSAFEALEDLNVDVGDLASNYVAVARDQIGRAAVEDWPFGDFKSEAIMPIVREFRDADKPLPTIDAALERIAKNRSWSEEDILALDSCSEDDLYNWMLSDPPDLNAKIRRGLLYFDEQSSDSRYAAIGGKAVAALKRVARLSPLNRLRVESMFRIDLGGEAGTAQ